MPKPDKTDQALSDAARAVVRDAGDPRIDAHLKALGLSPDEAPPGPPQREAEATADLAAQLAAALASLETERRRVRALVVALVVAVAVDLLLLAVRLAG